MPEVEALASFLDTEAVGRVVTRVDVVAVNALKTYDPPPTALAGLTVEAVRRHGKFLDLELSGLHLVIHLARAGWLRWRDSMPDKPPRPGRGPLGFRLHLARPDGDAGAGGFDLTEAGTQKRLAVYVVHDVRELPGVARLGPDPLDPADRKSTL